MWTGEAPLELEPLRDFVSRNLPRDANRDLPRIVQALRGAAQRYERLAERRAEWSSYGQRRKRLQAIEQNARQLADGLAKLDIVSRDSLEGFLGVERFDAMLGSANILASELNKLLDSIPKHGRPPDIAEERWIQEVAGIYELEFERKASIWSKGNPGPFYRLLQLARPDSLPRYGKLTPRQVTRVLKRQRGATLRRASRLIQFPPSAPTRLD